MAIGSYYVWEADGSSASILLSLKLVDRLQTFITEAVEPGQRTREVSGILLGHIENGVRPVVTIDDCEPLTQPSALKKRLEAWRSRKAGSLEPIGYVRAHYRPNLYLDQEDLSLLETYFADPAASVLLVKPIPHDVPLAGFFVRDGQPLPNQTPALTFPFSCESLLSGPFTILQAPEDESVSHMDEEIIRKPRRWPKTLAVGVGLLLAVLLLPLVAYYVGLKKTAHRPSQDLGLNVERTSNSLRLLWNPNNAAVTEATGGIVWITDGGTLRRMDLSVDQVKRGNVLYVPLSDDVGFRLEVNGGEHAMDSIRMFAPGFAKGPIDPATATAPAADEARASPGNGQTGSAERAGANRPTQKKKSSGPNEGDEAQENAFHLSPIEPSPQISTPATLAPPRFVARRSEVPVPSVVSIEPGQDSFFRRTFAKVRGVRALVPRGFRADSTFSPAKVAYERPPALPATLANQLPGERPVDLKVTIDAAGKPTRIESLSPNADKRVLRVSTDAVSNWRFTPARSNDKPVGSSLIVHIRYRNPVG